MTWSIVIGYQLVNCLLATVVSIFPTTHDNSSWKFLVQFQIISASPAMYPLHTKKGSKCNDNFYLVKNIVKCSDWSSKWQFVSLIEMYTRANAHMYHILLTLIPFPFMVITCPRPPKNKKFWSFIVSIGHIYTYRHAHINTHTHLQNYNTGGGGGIRKVLDRSHRSIIYNNGSG